MIPGVNDTLDKLKRLHVTKNQDYSGGHEPFFNFDFAEYFSSLFKHTKDKVYAVIVGIKLARLSIVLQRSPNHESVEDTFDDIILYTTIWKSDYVSRKVKSIPQLVEEATIRESK